VISNILGCEPIRLNSRIVSAQNRERLYWTNIPFVMPKNLNLTIADILDFEAERKYFDMNRIKTLVRLKNCVAYACSENGKFFQSSRAYFIEKKCGALAKSSAKDINKFWHNNTIAYFTVNEHEKLQTVPINYTICATNTQRIEMLGNGWTVKIIEQFFMNLNQQPVLRPTTLSLF
jgi:DNA (cytosine-5)-methyltransferase 3A